VTRKIWQPWYIQMRCFHHPTVKFCNRLRICNPFTCIVLAKYCCLTWVLGMTRFQSCFFDRTLSKITVII
jgi:hypothetical protein